MSFCSLLRVRSREYRFVKPPGSIRILPDRTLVPPRLLSQRGLYSVPDRFRTTLLVVCRLVIANLVKDTIDGQALIRVGSERPMDAADHSWLGARCGVLL